MPLPPRATEGPCCRYKIRIGGGEKYPRRERGLLALTQPLDPGEREGAPQRGERPLFELKLSFSTLGLAAVLPALWGRAVPGLGVTSWKLKPGAFVFSDAP